MAALAAALFLAGGCAPPEPPSSELFPLEPGHRWTFNQTTELENGRIDSSWLVMRTLEEDEYAGQPAWRRRSDDGMDYWLRRDATGIYRVASKHELEQDVRKDPAPRYVLKEPLAVGTEWQAGTVAYLLERRQGFPPEIRHEAKDITMRYAIEALKETVSVPAGRFEGCLKVRGQAAVRLYVDGSSGWRDLPLTTREWYCPGPGLVRLERDEPAGSPLLIGGKLTLALHDWQRP
jgi:hypothetical protein